MTITNPVGVAPGRAYRPGFSCWLIRGAGSLIGLSRHSAVAVREAFSGRISAFRLFLSTDVTFTAGGYRAFELPFSVVHEKLGAKEPTVRDALLVFALKKRLVKVRILRAADFMFKTK